MQEAPLRVLEQNAPRGERGKENSPVTVGGEGEEGGKCMRHFLGHPIPRVTAIPPAAPPGSRECFSGLTNRARCETLGFLSF